MKLYIALLGLLITVFATGAQSAPTEHHVHGYDEFTKKVAELDSVKEPIYILFSGSKDETGNSWCPYCVIAEPLVMEALKEKSENNHFIHVDVGEKPYWKDLNCPFRTDERLHLEYLPTLMRWKSPQRIDGERVTHKDLIEKLINDN